MSFYQKTLQPDTTVILGLSNDEIKIYLCNCHSLREKSERIGKVFAIEIIVLKFKYILSGRKKNVRAANCVKQR